MASLDFEQEKRIFKEYYSDNFTLLQDSESFFCSLLASLLAGSDLFVPPTITSRLKNRDECIKKFTLKYQTGLEQRKMAYNIRDYITDLIGIRVVCLYEPDIYSIVKIVRSNFEVIDTTDKIAEVEGTENSFGYKGFHMDLRIDAARKALPEYSRYGNLQFELQIRTIIQDAWSVLDHKIKYKKSIPAPLKRRINALAAIFEIADYEFNNIKNETLALEQKGKELEDLAPQDQFLDVFDFFKAVRPLFPGFDFQDYKADGFVQLLRQLCPDLTGDQFSQALAKHLTKVTEYSEFEAKYYGMDFNPYTRIRHALYLEDKDKFSSLLYDINRQNFEKWLSGKQHAQELPGPHPLSVN